MIQGQTIGNTTDYFPNPCPYTVKYYSKQINDALKQAFKENPGWCKPGSRVDVIFIIGEIQEWYNPFLYTGLESTTFDRLWSEAMRELREMLNRKVPKVKGCRDSRKVRIGERYDPQKLQEIIRRLKEKGLTQKTIGILAGVIPSSMTHIVKGDGPYKNRVVSKCVNKLICFLDGMGIDTEGIIMKSFCRGPGDGFYKKSPLAAGGRREVNNE